MSSLKIPNRDARRLWLSVQGLAASPVGQLDLLAIIRQLGFVQLDTIQVVARAHHHILWSRNQNYREPMLNRLLAVDRAVFEHFTHDASVLPMEFLPMWRRQFTRMRMQLDQSSWYEGMPDSAGRDAIRERIAREGPLSTHAFDSEMTGAREMWRRPPHKLALEYLWYAGELATSHREGFSKHYDLADRVFPTQLLAENVPAAEQINWLCRSALQRLGFGTLTDIRRFWEATDSAEVKTWASDQNKDLVPVSIEAADGSWRTGLALGDIEVQLAQARQATSRLRILNPFDPVIRDRNRLQQLFGFDYRVEMFVPRAKRQWGYYIYPLLEGDRFVGRIEIKGDRKGGCLRVLQLWREPGIRWSTARAAKLDAELDRLARFIGVTEVFWDCSRDSQQADHPA